MTAPTPSERWSERIDAACTICRSAAAEQAFVVDGHRIVRCEGCGHLYVSPRPPMDEVAQIYGEAYFENPAFRDADHDAYFGYMDYLGDRDNIQLRLAQVLAHAETLQPVGRLLDIGCGPGLFVDVAARRGWDAWGIDLNESAVKWAQENVTDQVHVGTVSDLGLPEGSFGCVTMLDVIEHLADPREELFDVWRALEPGGLLVVVTPDAGALVSRLLGSHWLEMKRAPEHLQFFSLQGLAHLLELSGFAPIEWHSIGKISTVRAMLADLRFYSARIVSAVERGLDRYGWADRVVDIDPRTKLCLYAQKVGEPVSLDRLEPPRRWPIPRARTTGIGRIGVRFAPRTQRASAR